MGGVCIMVDPVFDFTGVRTRIQKVLVSARCTPVCNGGVLQLCPDKGLSCNIVTLVFPRCFVTGDDLLDLLVGALFAACVVTTRHLAVELTTEAVCTIIGGAVHICKVVAAAIGSGSHPDSICTASTRYAPAIVSKLDRSTTFITSGKQYWLRHGCFSVCLEVRCPRKLSAVDDAICRRNYRLGIVRTVQIVGINRTIVFRDRRASIFLSSVGSRRSVVVFFFFRYGRRTIILIPAFRGR